MTSQPHAVPPGDLRALLDHAPMSRLQIVGIAICVLLSAVDGFDVLAISFAAPGIVEQWNVDRAALGFVLSMELIGMAAGSMLLGVVADRIGRRPTALFCLAVVLAGMVGAALARSLAELATIRLLTGLGIGGMLAATNTMVAELANARARSSAVAFMAVGYPLGAVVGGSIAAKLLATGDWRDVFLLGAALTTLCLPLMLAWLPESPDFLLRREADDRLNKVNRLVQRMGHPPFASLVPVPHQGAGASRALLLGPSLLPTTILLTSAYFCHIMTFYFILKWAPKIVVDMGYDQALAGSVLVWANVGGFIGAVLLSTLSWRIPIIWLVIGAMIGAGAMVVLFGQPQSGLGALSLVAAIAGFFTTGAVVGIHSIVAQAFPAEVRASGTGIVLGLGRGGAALGPILAGLLFAGGVQLPGVAMVMASGSLIAAIALTIYARRPKLA